MLGDEARRGGKAHHGNAVLHVVAADSGVAYSPATAELIDREINQIISRQYEAAVNILTEKRTALEKGAALLLEKESIAGHDIKALIEEQPMQAVES